MDFLLKMHFHILAVLFIRLTPLFSMWTCCIYFLVIIKEYIMLLHHAPSQLWLATVRRRAISQNPIGRCNPILNNTNNNPTRVRKTFTWIFYFSSVRLDFVSICWHTFNLLSFVLLLLFSTVTDGGFQVSLFNKS